MISSDLQGVNASFSDEPHFTDCGSRANPHCVLSKEAQERLADKKDRKIRAIPALQDSLSRAWKELPGHAGPTSSFNQN